MSPWPERVHDPRTAWRRLHDKDPVAYHSKLARVGVGCGFCEEDKKRGKM